MVRVRYSFGSRHTGNIANIAKQRKKYPKVADEVIRVSDIILEVLDARFINETRNLQLENLIKKSGKHIIYVLNKSDLIDKREVAKNLELYPYVFVSCIKREGSFILRNMIKRLLKKIDLPDRKERAQVGIIGYPNTGKSSLINFLTGKSSAKTANEAGFTKGVQKIRLTSDILILDTPGVIPEKEYSMSDKAKMIKHSMVGAKSLHRIKDPDLVIQKLLEKYKDKLEEFYEVKSEDNAEVFLENVAKKKGFLKKGGFAEVDRAARQVLKDWQDGKIRV